MATLKQESMDYETPQTLNIADLDKVSVGLEINENTATNSEGEEFTYKYVELNGKQYRVPNSVLDELKTILSLKPDVEFVKVNKSGSGLGTRYKVEVIHT